MRGQHRTAWLTGFGGGEGARVPGYWGAHLQRSVPPADEGGFTVSYDRETAATRRRAEQTRFGLGLLEDAPVRYQILTLEASVVNVRCWPVATTWDA